MCTISRINYIVLRVPWSLTKVSSMEKSAANVWLDIHGRSTNAKLQSATICLVQIAVMQTQVSVEWVLEPAMDLTEKTTLKDARSDQQQQWRRVQRKADEKGWRKTNLNVEATIPASIMHIMYDVHADMNGSRNRLGWHCLSDIPLWSAMKHVYATILH